MFEQLTDKLEDIFKCLCGQNRLSEENIGETLREIHVVPLAADVIHSLTPGQVRVKIVHDELMALLGGEAEEPSFQGAPPFQILMMGLQGSDKTTAAGKQALHLRDQRGKKPLLVACDVYRPAAIDQLKVIGKSLDVPVYDEGEGDPVRIAENGRKFARDNGLDLVIYDTAGRLQIDEEPAPGQRAAASPSLQEDGGVALWCSNARGPMEPTASR